jgi:hypothetical protein
MMKGQMCLEDVQKSAVELTAAQTSKEKYLAEELGRLQSLGEAECDD